MSLAVLARVLIGSIAHPTPFLTHDITKHHVQPPPSPQKATLPLTPFLTHQKTCVNPSFKRRPLRVHGQHRHGQHLRRRHGQPLSPPAGSKKKAPLLVCVRVCERENRPTKRDDDNDDDVDDEWIG